MFPVLFYVTANDSNCFLRSIFVEMGKHEIQHHLKLITLQLYRLRHDYNGNMIWVLDYLEVF